jgi:hypothetical protein
MHPFRNSCPDETASGFAPDAGNPGRIFYAVPRFSPDFRLIFPRMDVSYLV